MNREISFVIYDKPIPLQRHRHTARCSYDPQKEEKETYRTLMQYYLSQFPSFDGEFLEGPLHLLASFYFKLPKTKKLRNSKGLYHIVKGDLDNYLKLAMDCMTGILYKDDCTIYKISAIKCYTTEKERTEITIKEITQADIIKENEVGKPQKTPKEFIPARISK